MNPPADGTPKNLEIQLETPRSGGVFCFQKLDEKVWGPACPLLGGRWDHPRPCPRKRGGRGRPDLRGGGEKGQGGRSEGERKPHNCFD
jgi:hypothetical protein